MALLLDPTTGTAAKVSASGGLLITPGGDGYPTYMTRFGSARLTAAAAPGTYVWAIRAPATKTLDLREGRLRLTHDPIAAVATTSVIEFVRFSAADPAGGTALTPVNKQTSEAAPFTVALREAGAASLVTLAGATIGAAAAGFGTLALPNGVSAQGELALNDFTGMYLAPGEGLALRVVAALPIGSMVSGMLEFSER